MKSELRAKPHSVYPDQTVLEVWFNGQFIATVTGADGPGVRVISKHTLKVSYEAVPPTSVPLNAALVTVQV